MTGEWFGSIVFERPTTWTGVESADKQQREATQLRRFIRAFDRATDSSFGVLIGTGSDPPDLIVGRGEHEIGVELTQLVYQDRVEAWAAMQSTKRGLLSVDRGRFSHLIGLCVYVAYDRNQGLPKPGRRGVEELKEALLRFRPASGSPEAPPRGVVLQPSPAPGTWSTGHTELAHLPEQLPEGAVQTVGRLSLMSTPLSRNETGMFPGLRGFDVALSIQTDVWESSAWTTFAARVAEKDRPGTDVIVVSSGAPVVKGNSFPSDEIAGEAVLAAADSRALDPTSHAKAVYLHSWESERIAEFQSGESGATLLAP